MTLRLRLAFLFAAVLSILSGLFLISAQGHLLRQLQQDRVTGAAPGTRLSEQEVRNFIRELTRLWIVAGVPVVGLSFLLGFLLAARSVHHLRQINAGLATMRPGDMHSRIKVPDRDPELQDLVRGINDLLDRVGRSYGELSEFSSRVAHELRTPLTLLRLRIEENADKLPPDISEDLQEEIRRLSRLVERSLVTARAEGGVLQLENTRFLICETITPLREDYAALADLKGLTLRWHCPAELAVVGDKDATLQIMHNLLDNAVRSARSEIVLNALSADRGGLVKVEVTNDTREIEPADRGTGIGLRLCQAIAKTMPGWEFRSALEGSAYRVTVSAPAA